MVSLELIRSMTPDLATPILDVDGGSSTLVDGLIEAGYRQVMVLDLAAASSGSHRRARRNWLLHCQ